CRGPPRASGSASCWPPTWRSLPRTRSSPRAISISALAAEAAGLAARLVAGPTYAYGRTKALLQATLGDAFDAQLRRETESFAACAATADFAEGVRAFLEKRRPVFAGE